MYINIKLIILQNNYAQFGFKDIPDAYEQFVKANTIKERVIKVISGYDYTFLLTHDGSLYSFGCNSDGQLGHIGHECEIVTFFEDKPAIDVDVNFETTIVLTRTYQLLHHLYILRCPRSLFCREQCWRTCSSFRALSKDDDSQ